MFVEYKPAPRDYTTSIIPSGTRRYNTHDQSFRAFLSSNFPGAILPGNFDQRNVVGKVTSAPSAEYLLPPFKVNPSSLLWELCDEMSQGVPAQPIGWEC